MRRTLAALAALAGAAAPALAQQKVTKSPGAGAPRAAATAASAAADQGAFVVRLGSDTVAVERFAYTPIAGGGTRVEGDLFNRSPMPRVTHYVVDLDAQGRTTRAEYATRRPDGTPLPNGALGVVAAFRNDSVHFEARLPDSTANLRAPAPAGTILSIPNSFAMYELAMRAMRAGRQDSGAVHLVAPGAPRAQPVAARLSGDAATIDYFGDPMQLRVDPTGRILAVDGTRTTNKVVVERVPASAVAALDIGVLARDFAARAPMGPTSPRDTARATVGAAQLLVDYGRPSARGRTIWGGTLVPAGQVWRTGANQATHFRTSTDLTLGELAVPAGTYTLFTLPNADGSAQLIVSKQTGQWGTEYKPEMDLGRLTLTSTTLAEPVEQFTIAIEPAGTNAGQLVMRWGTRQFTAPITVGSR